MIKQCMCFIRQSLVAGQLTHLVGFWQKRFYDMCIRQQGTKRSTITFSAAFYRDILCLWCCFYSRFLHIKKPVLKNVFGLFACKPHTINAHACSAIWAWTFSPHTQREKPFNWLLHYSHCELLLFVIVNCILCKWK